MSVSLTLVGAALSIGVTVAPSLEIEMKTISSGEAVSMIPNGASLMIGGFMGVGTPERLVDEIVHQGKRDLSVIANDTAKPGTGIGKLVAPARVVFLVSVLRAHCNSFRPL